MTGPSVEGSLLSGSVRKVILIRVDLRIHFHFHERWRFPVHDASSFQNVMGTSRQSLSFINNPL